jgi:hypothetical protein
MTSEFFRKLSQLLGLATVLASLGTTLLASGGVRTPEIDGSAAVTAAGLIAGGVLILRARRRSK